ncbi:MAG: alpha/beta hydrolase [Solirubrobacteraceae bacterium]|nr:alpha/beta hydrolase [Solirubrobacteraceae bacterium]
MPVFVTSEPITFTTDGEATAAALWLPPTAAGPVPAVATGPGFGGVKEMLIPTYAQALASAGIATLAFDPVGFGGSAGARRQHIDPHQQVRSFGAALSALQVDPRIDASRLGVFGTSLSGGHALRCAADDPRVRCAATIVPFIRLQGRQTPGHVGRVAWEVVRRLLGQPDRYLAAAGSPGDRAAMTTDGALEWLQVIAADAPSFRNEVTISSLFALARYSSSRAAKRAAVPTLAIVAERDSITPGALVRSALPDAAHVRIVGFPETHFELFTTHLDETVELVRDWFKEHLSDG